MDYPYDIGDYACPVSTDSVAAQMWFNRGIIWLYAFDLELAGRCFGEAIACDEQCAMAHWGLAYSSGIYYNKPWARMQSDELAEKLRLTYDISRDALARIDNASPVERQMIEALQFRYQSPTPVDTADYHRWDDEYAAAMRKVYKNFPENNDVCALTAEALMTRTPWALWELKSGLPASNASTEEAIAILEEGMARLQNAGTGPHPGMLHMYIHVMEMSPFPEKALPACDALRDIAPGSGHLIHMPTHIDVQCGHYHNVLVDNQRGIAADRKYYDKVGALNFYSAYRLHNYHFAIYGAMFLGQYEPALAAAEELIETTPEELLRLPSPPMADFIESYISMKQHVYIRFGKWQEIIAQDLPEDRELYCVTTASIHYSKGVAHAALGEVEEAEREKALFLAARNKVPDSRLLHTNTCIDLLAIATEMLDGEIEYRKGNHDVAFAHLRRAVELDDALLYDEPWGWMQPVRHALGALSLEQGRVEEAEQAYREDLGLAGNLPRACIHPDNIWSLKGLDECLRRRGASDTDEAKLIEQRLKLAAARSDLPVGASCHCAQAAMQAVAAE